MTINISILKETKEGEKRVAMVPSVAPRLARLGATLSLQSGAGETATFADSAYAGATTVADPKKLVADADIVLAVQSPSASVIRAMKPGAVLVSFIYGASASELMAALQERRVTALAMELIPRISRARRWTRCRARQHSPATTRRYSVPCTCRAYCR